ncbi:MAG: PAS domain S-box protein [Desulfosalsimonadaceae bacterium]|nr:PAS domain S-box protein [Desulfosalsimonadaceae bacterium]
METTPLKLLVIDGTPDHLAFLQEILSNAFPGSALLPARDGASGIKLAETEDPDVVLLNFTGPDMDGFDICRRLKSDGRLRDIPLVFIADRNATDPEALRKALEAGADGFLSVPLEEMELIAQMKTLSRLKAAGRMQPREKEHLAELVAKRTPLLEKQLAERKRAEDALRQNEEQYRLIAENMSDVISVLDMNLRFTYVSPSIKRLTGFTVEEAMKHSIQEIMTPESLKNALKAFEEEMMLEASGTADPYRTRIIEFEQNKQDISIVWVEAACSFLRDKERKPTGILVISRDITERKRAEKILKESEEQYRLLFQNASEGILIARGDKIHMANRALVKILEHSEEILKSKPFTEFIHPEDRSMVLDRHIRRFKGEPVETNYSFRVITGEEKEKWVQIHSSIIDWKGASASLSFVTDITDRKQAEAERELLMAAIEQAGEVVVITNPDGIIQYVNPAFEEVTGYIREEVIGQNPRILKSGRQDVIFYQQLWETITSGRVWSGRMVNKRKDGALYTEDATISPVCDAAGRIINYVGVKRDITDNLRLSAQYQQAQKMESVGRLAGGVAHDFYNMLSVILGYTELAMDQVDRDTPLHADLEEVFKAANRSTDITRQLLAFARQQIVLPRILNLNTSIEAMLKMLRRLIGEDISLIWLPGPNLWPVRMDPSQIDQILANLCVNARDAIADIGSITIQTVNTVHKGAGVMPQDGKTASGEFVLLSLSDTGCGMDQAIIDKIFEPFFTTKEKGQGTGLGLATVYGIVKQNNGFIHVTSEPGKGTAFHVYLPRHTAEALSDMDEKAIDVPKGQGEMILVVDDEFAVLLLAKKILESAGYHALTADTPAEAMRLAEGYAGEIHLLITDVIMPEMNGRVLAEHLKSRYPNLKCLYMSGYTGNIISRHGVIGEGIHFIQKPFSIKELTLKVRETLDA